MANPKSCKELWPISILPLPGKILEQVIHEHIKLFIDKSKYFNNQQNGLRQNKSTIALAALMDELLGNTEKGELTIAIYMDLKKAFDTIDHEVLLHKLEKLKAPEITLQIGSETLREVDASKYLGTTLDATLNASQILSKLKQSVAIKRNTFRRMRDYISENTAIMFYKTLILLIIDYSDIVYSLLTKQQQYKLQRTQNRVLRTVFNGKRVSTKEMHDGAKLDYLADRTEAHLLDLMRICSINDKYIDNKKRVTRAGESTRLTVRRPLTNKLMKAPIFAGRTARNNLPYEIKEQHIRGSREA
jgi:sarcosine oxidase/L-pipecolate oxidase